MKDVWKQLFLDFIDEYATEYRSTDQCIMVIPTGTKVNTLTLNQFLNENKTDVHIVWCLPPCHDIYLITLSSKFQSTILIQYNKTVIPKNAAK